LLIQRPGKCLAGRALRGHAKAMRRKISRQLLRRQALVGDVSFLGGDRACSRRPGEGRDP